MTNRTFALALAPVALFALAGYSSCDPILENNGFDLWCGKSLCYWEVERGAVRSVPTWHEADRGVELVGSDVSLSQLSDINDANGVACIRFDLVADVEETAGVALQVDYDDDGTMDEEHEIPTSDWAPVSYLIALPPAFDGIRFRIEKVGGGRAVLAQIAAEESDACLDPGAPGGRSE